MHSRHRKLTASWRYFISAINLSIKRLSLQPSPENEVYCVVPIMEIQLIFKTILSWPPNRSNLIKYVFLFHSRTTHVSTFFVPIRRKNWAQRMYKWVMMFLNQNIFRQQFWNTDYCRLRLKVNQKHYLFNVILHEFASLKILDVRWFRKTQCSGINWRCRIPRIYAQVHWTSKMFTARFVSKYHSHIAYYYLLIPCVVASLWLKWCWWWRVTMCHVG